MRKGVSLVLVALIVAVAAAQEFWGGAARQPGAGDYAAEAGGALLGGALVGAGAAAMLGSAAGGPASPLGILLGGAVGVALGYPLGCGLGTTIAGRATHADGSTGGAYAGAYIGLPVGIGLALIGGAAPDWNSWFSTLAPVFFVAGGLAPPVGAVIGYNTGVSSSLGARLAPPTLAYRSGLGPERQRCSAFDFRLVTVRF